MTPQPQHMRSHGNKRQYHIPKERYSEIVESIIKESLENQTQTEGG